MASRLSDHIRDLPLSDTHEHLRKEAEWVDDGPVDVLADLFSNYVPADLISAGATPEAVRNLGDAAAGSPAERLSAIEPAWQAIRHTGYGEAVHILASEVYGLGDDWSGADLEAAGSKLAAWRQPGGRRKLLQEAGGIDHCQTDDFCWACPPDESGRDFFLYDIGVPGLCSGLIEDQPLAKETGIEVTDLASLKRAMTAIFEQHGGTAVAVKAQHAYGRTLEWHERSDAEAQGALDRVLAGGDVDTATRLAIGDWCWAALVERAVEHDLPFKLHTGYYAGNDRMPVSRIRAGNLCGLLAKYLDCRFVLMHIAYPYDRELVALAKHYRNVWVDLCWAWSIDPYSGMDFVRRYLHAAPANKLFVFGGDTAWPTSAVAYAIQARRWLTRALQAEVDDGLLTEVQAIDVATRWMRDNQEQCFRVEAKKERLRTT